MLGFSPLYSEQSDYQGFLTDFFYFYQEKKTSFDLLLSTHKLKHQNQKEL